MDVYMNFSLLKSDLCTDLYVLYLHYNWWWKSKKLNLRHFPHFCLLFHRFVSKLDILKRQWLFLIFWFPADSWSATCHITVCIFRRKKFKIHYIKKTIMCLSKYVKPILSILSCLWFFFDCLNFVIVTGSHESFSNAYFTLGWHFTNQTFLIIDTIIVA